MQRFAHDMPAPMKLIIKFFPEITIKSRQVRKRFIAQLKGNLKKLLAAIDPQARVNGNWDSLEVNLGSDPALQQQCIERLRNTPGIAHFFAVQEYPLGTLDELVELCVANLGDQVQGKTFAVRCKRVGTHPFSSQDVGIKVGSVLRSNGGQVLQAKHHGFSVAFGLACKASSLADQSGMPGNSLAKRE